MASTAAPTKEELVRRTAELVPLLRKTAVDADENRILPDEVIEAMTEAGIPKMRVPARFGGYESDVNTVVEVLAEVGRGDGSASWVASVWAISTWMMGLFPDEVQEEVFSTPDVRITGILSPTAIGVPTEGGILLNGKWSFNSGARQSHWNANAAMLAHPGGEHEPIMVAVPLSDLRIVDDWHTSGLRGTGSITTIAEDVFVPQARVLSMGPVLAGQHPAQLNASSRIHRAPFMPTACTTISAPAVGLARAAREAFLERLPGRKITYTDYDNQSEAPLTHLQVAEAKICADEAEFHAFDAANLLDAKATQPWTVEDRALVRLHLGAVCRRAKEAVDILNTASGGSSLYSTVPIQRIARDIQAINLHAILHPNTNLELYGRIACGLGPNTPYI
ncbi:acyl-CoA dehydrogenase [Saccharomonospora marina XMU15]|uniref:Acyl-CoA dehydrogenase n=1 Tax=Saccharomonospora marina XMU15 TaxID=882083 RepID=H5XBX2_9PSEU|nr:acyl-CoA dehydrogenase family protein [Saccharomonospora marina]EHR52759.1 acyl-CoA dehydrogenase [Saccharomonospora marina XMU15]